MDLVCLLALLLGSAPVSDASPPIVLRVSVEPNTVILHGGEPQQGIITTEVRDAAGHPVRDAALLFDSTAGVVETFREIAPGVYQAALRRPVEAFPQVGVVTVFVAPSQASEPPVVGTAVVQYAAEIDLRGRTEAGASMRVEVGGRTFGPVTADVNGRFALPVVVPPGAGTARGTSTDTLDNASISSINLYLPALDRLHSFVYPRTPVADGVSPAWIFVTCLSSSGAPQKGALLTGDARGLLGAPQPLGTGLWRVPYVAPTSVAPGHDTVHFRAPLQAEEQIALTAGPPARLVLDLAPDSVPADGASTALATLHVFDTHDNPAEAPRVRIDVDGAPVEPSLQGIGLYNAVLPGRTHMGDSAVVATVWRPDGTALPPVHSRLTFRLPTAVSLALSVVERRADGWLVHIDSHGDAQLAARLTLRASRGDVTRTPGGDWFVAVATAGDESLDVVALDPQTGVSAWLRVPVEK